MDSDRSLKLAVLRLEKIDPKTEKVAVKDLRNEAELARVLEARARLRGKLLTHGS